MRSAPVAPVITGNITTRKRSTIPARSSERDRLTLPSVLRMPEPSSFIARTASTASPRTRLVLAHARGSSGEAEHQPVRVRAHQVRHRGLLAEPGEVLGPFETPPAGPALPRRVAVQGGDEVDHELSHRDPPRAMDWSSGDVGVRT